jgi:hypothetical protein
MPFGLALGVGGGATVLVRKQRLRHNSTFLLHPPFLLISIALTCYHDTNICKVILFMWRDVSFADIRLPTTSGDQGILYREAKLCIFFHYLMFPRITITNQSPSVLTVFVRNAHINTLLRIREFTTDMFFTCFTHLNIGFAIIHWDFRSARSHFPITGFCSLMVHDTSSRYKNVDTTDRSNGPARLFDSMRDLRLTEKRV